jgi:transposase
MASQSPHYSVEHLNHLGIVAKVCREIGVADWLDQHDPTGRQHVSVGKATVAMVLNGLGFSNRQLYLVPQFFADKPVEHLLGDGITAEDLHDDCLGRTLDWLYEHDVTALFAGLAQRARRMFGVQATTWHGDTTSFSVHGQYTHPDDQSEGDETLIEVTYGYSRDHREDLKQWMLTIITSGEGVPLFLRPLSGNASDKRSLREAVLALREHLKGSDEEPGVYVADSGLYSTENMTTLAQVAWISRVPETLTMAHAMTREDPDHWNTTKGRRVSGGVGSSM